MTCSLSLAAALSNDAVVADSFASAHYDGRNDALVVTMNYRGTNPNHTFSLQWGACKQAANAGDHSIDAQVLDSQWQDAALREYQKTSRFSLAGISCRPATLTLRTAPRFYYTLRIPRAARSQR